MFLSMLMNSNFTDLINKLANQSVNTTSIQTGTVFKPIWTGA